MFAGSLQGVTQTLSLAVYQEFDVNFENALAIGALLVVASALVLFAVKARPDMDTLRLDLDHGLRTFRLAVALEVGAETVALVGPSGAGKSSVLRAVAGLLRPEHGVVALGAETWLDSDSRNRPPAGAPPSRARIPGVRALPAPRRARQRRLRCPRSSGASRSCSSAFASTISHRLAHATSPEASGSASRSRGRSRASLTSCSSTSRCQRSTRTRGAPCAESCTS